ncbi:MAG: PDZ domain-containing protein [Proteobacteria bacterium]|nr:PDZ domain-containing protein [Pseudomonadota bacterium]NIS62569.1 PDZ domain-containing protein [Pseudomonadota bacterium]
MKRGLLLIILSVFIAFPAPAQADQAAEEILKAIVKVHSIVPKDARSAGSLGTEREGNGVLIDAQGHILTIGYLILEAETIEVVGPEGKPITATFVGYDHATGFGILRTDKPLSVTPMKLGQSSEVNQGDPILVAGHGGKDSVQPARVVSRGEFAGYWEYLLDDAIYTSPPHPEFGGAALIGRDGQLLGIGSIFTQLVVSGVGSLPCNMFVPIDLLKPILADLITRGRSREPSKPWLGLSAEEAHGRVFVLRVRSEGPAAQAGLKPGDIILSVGKKPVKGLADFYRKVWALGGAGVDVPLSVLQGTQIRDITVQSADRYQYFRLEPGKGGGKVSRLDKSLITENYDGEKRPG